MKRAQRHTTGSVRYDKRRKTWELSLVRRANSPLQADWNETGISDQGGSMGGSRAPGRPPGSGTANEGGHGADSSRALRS